MSMNFKMLAKTLYGFEPLLAKELRNLGASHVKEGVRNVTFEGDLGFLYKANLNLRTVIRSPSGFRLTAGAHFTSER